MDLETARSIKSAKDIEEHKSLRFWANMFWSVPIILCSAAFVALGPIYGTVICIILLALCIPIAIRKIMYFLFTGFIIVLGLFGGLGGIIASVVCCVLYALICGANLAYVKQAKELKEYERIINN